MSGSDLGLAAQAPSSVGHPRLGYRVSLDLGTPVHVIGLNTAWLCGDRDAPNGLLLTDDQLQRLATNGGESLDGLRIALMHHPFSDLQDGWQIQRLMAGRVDLVLRGHLHFTASSHFMLDADRQFAERVRRLERTTEELRRTIERLTRLLDEGTATRAVESAPARPRKTEPIRERPSIPTAPTMLVEEARLREEPAVVAEASARNEALPPTPPTAPPQTPAPPRHRADPLRPRKPEKPFDWEALIGVRFFAIVASLALFLAGGFFVRRSRGSARFS